MSVGEKEKSISGNGTRRLMLCLLATSPKCLESEADGTSHSSATAPPKLRMWNQHESRSTHLNLHTPRQRHRMHGGCDAKVVPITSPLLSSFFESKLFLHSLTMTIGSLFDPTEAHWEASPSINPVDLRPTRHLAFGEKHVIIPP